MIVQELAGTFGLALPMLCLIVYLLWSDYRPTHRRADRFSLWAMMIGRRIDWTKVPPIEHATVQDGQIVNAEIQQFPLVPRVYTWPILHRRSPDNE